MERICDCCGRTLKGNTCEYCGHTNVFALDAETELRMKERANQYRKDMVRQITDISIEAYRYLGSELQGRKKINIADGEKCFKTVNWAGVKFAQNTDMTEPERDLTIMYNVNGQKKKLSATIELIETSDFWEIGVELTECLSLVVYLGTRDNYTISEPYELELR